MTAPVPPLFVAGLDYRAPGQSERTSIRVSWPRGRSAELVGLANLLDYAAAKTDNAAAAELANLLHQVIQFEVTAHGTAACFPTTPEATQGAFPQPGSPCGRPVREEVPGAAAGRSRPIR